MKTMFWLLVGTSTAGLAWSFVRLAAEKACPSIRCACGDLHPDPIEECPHGPMSLRSEDVGRAMSELR